MTTASPYMRSTASRSHGNWVSPTRRGRASRSGSTLTSSWIWVTSSGRLRLGDGARARALPKVVILGGGVAGMTAAMELSRPGWQQRYESITVYQYGWRLGGKGASGRGAHERIEEHGLHIWLGFYDNAFRLLRECYEELGRDSSVPIRSIGEAFERASLFIVQEPRGDGWVPWFAEFPESDEMPGVRPAQPPSLWELMIRALRLALAYNEDAHLTRAGLATTCGVSLRPFE